MQAGRQADTVARLRRDAEGLESPGTGSRADEGGGVILNVLAAVIGWTIEDIEYQVALWEYLSAVGEERSE